MDEVDWSGADALKDALEFPPVSKDATIAFLRSEVSRLQARVSELGGMLSTEEWQTIADDGGPDSVAAWLAWRGAAPHGNEDERPEATIEQLRSCASDMGAAIAEAKSWQNTHRPKTVPKGRT